jgi:hypothetical protein
MRTKKKNEREKKKKKKKNEPKNKTNRNLMSRAKETHTLTRKNATKQKVPKTEKTQGTAKDFFFFFWPRGVCVSFALPAIICILPSRLGFSISSFQNKQK